MRKPKQRNTTTPVIAIYNKDGRRVQDMTSKYAAKKTVEVLDRTKERDAPHYSQMVK